jgi:citrate lyase alpha subunit
MSDFDWAEFGGDRVSFDAIGDKVKGRVTAIEKREGMNGVAPVLTLQVDADGNTTELWASATDLKQKLAQKNVQVGCLVEVEFIAEKHTGKPQPMKIFEVKVGAPIQTAAAPVPTPPAADTGEEPY